MKTFRFKHVDAFTTKPLTGNYAGVVFNADTLSDLEMHSIAREINLPETAFILSPTTEKADIQIRWFTPTTEVPLCGHATIAAFHALAEDGEAGMKTNGQHYFNLQTKSGILPIRVEKNFCSIAVEFELPHPKFSIRKDIPSTLLKALGVSKNDLEKKLPIVSASYLYIPLSSLRTLQKMKPEFQLLSNVLSKMKTKEVCVFTLETVEKSNSVHSRFFAPLVGIPEDPVTGSANGPLGVYLAKYAIPSGFRVHHRELSDGRIEFVGEQGDEIGRAGRVRIRLQHRGTTIERVTIGGEAKTIISGTISL